MKQLIFLLILVIVFITGCITSEECTSGLYTKDGKCCTYVCDKDCPYGYVEGTCNCECEEVPASNETEGLNIDDIFGEDGDITPPVIPERKLLLRAQPIFISIPFLKDRQ